MAILGKLFWFALFLACTFSFLVIFEHGVTNFPENAQKESVSLQKLFRGKAVNMKLPPQG